MSQTGYTPIQLYYSTTASNTPSVANLSLGELGINLADQKAYMLNAAGTAVVTLVGTLGNQNANSVSITGGSVNGTTIGATTASTGAFTTISATGVITSTVATGTAPFTIASTTQVANLNAATAGTATNATNTVITDNTSSSATWYPTIVSATTGNLPQTTSSTKLSFVPSTGTLTATSHAGAWAGSTIGTTYGGTGLTSFTANGVVYASSTSALATGSALQFDGTNLLVGTTNSQGAKVNTDAGSSSAYWGRTTATGTAVNVVWNSATSGDNQFAYFYTDAAPNLRGSITYNRAGGLTVYNTTSDYRAKDISGPVSNSGALIDSVPVYMGKMKWATEERPMFIAHETPSYAHTGTKDAVDADGNPVYQQMDASALIPVMWAEIQDLRKRLATLEAK